MQTFRFYLPHYPSSEIKDLFDEIWKENSNMNHMIYVKRVSQFGNQYVKGLLTMNSDSEPFIIPEIQLYPSTNDKVEEAYRFFEHELETENNGSEYSSQ